MGKIRIKNDKNNKVKLPEIVAIKNKDREKLIVEKCVKSLIDSPQLLSKSLNKLLYETITRSSEIQQMIDETTNPLRPHPPTNILMPHIISIAKKKYPKKKPGDIPSSKIRVIFDLARKEYDKKKSIETREKIIKISLEIEDLLDGFKTDNSGSEINILSRKFMYFCGSCSHLYAIDEFRSGTCKCGLEFKKAARTQKEGIVVVDEGVVKFFQQNIWLEYGVEKLFVEEEYNTVCGLYILGNSGVKHEIDVLAEKKKRRIRIMVECKNSSISLGILFNVFSKMNDLGLNRAYIFSTGSVSSDDVLYFAQSKNIIIFEQIFEQDFEKVKKILSNNN